MKIKRREELISKFLEFFRSKAHRIIPSSSLIPERDPSVLFTTAGMHPLVPYLLGEKHPLGKRLVNVQKCIRTQDIDYVGDEVHHTFYKMLGNFSFGDYWKKEAIEYSFEFLINVLKIEKDKLAITCFGGDKRAPQLVVDNESAKIWLSLGIPKERIVFLEGGVFESKKNWWGPAGLTGPCGPDTEMFYWIGKDKPPRKFDPSDARWVEIWNDVFMAYEKTKIKAILVDAIYCLFDKDRNLNKELFSILSNYPTKLIIVANADLNDNKNKPLTELISDNIDIYTLKNNPDKTRPEYFEKLLSRYNLKPSEIIYFDHSEVNLNSAKKLRIKTELYKNPKQIQSFIDNNFYSYIPTKQKNVDTGMGVERTLAVLNGLEDNYKTSIFEPIIKEIEFISARTYKENERAMRIIADHLRAAVFILGDERKITPSNVEQGYVLRRLIRRAIRYGRILGMKERFTAKVAEMIVPYYKDYPQLNRNEAFIYKELDEEESKFALTLENGLRKFDNIVKNSGKKISGRDAFLLFQSYGFPIEITLELAKERGVKLDIEGYEKEFKKHQELSRTTSAGMFKSGLSDETERTTRMHTATHLLNEAIRKVLKDDKIKQKGSNINPERLRFDFNFSRKLTDEELKEIEKLVNEKIKQGLKIVREETPLQEAIASGAQAEFGTKYPDVVSVYTILDQNEKKGWFSREICTGPHVKNTKDIGKFKIIKEESVAAEIRRIKAVVE